MIFAMPTTLKEARQKRKVIMPIQLILLLWSGKILAALASIQHMYINHSIKPAKTLHIGKPNMSDN